MSLYTFNSYFKIAELAQDTIHVAYRVTTMIKRSIRITTIFNDYAM